MELGLSLGYSSRPFCEASNELTTLSIGPLTTIQTDHQQQQIQQQEDEKTKTDKSSNNNPLLHQLELSLPCPPPSEPVLSLSPNSAASSFQMDLCIYNRGCRSGGSLSGSGGGSKRNFSDCEAYDQRTSSRASDEDDNGGVGNTRKKLRLSKDQSAFLEETFKEHNTLNPKQKLALAKQLNLRPRQVEVWFQNRRARTKLKQTEVDCEYLKRCCETLTEENRRLHKELQELRALKTSNPFNMQLPATTLTMCPSCERVATNSTTTNSSVTTGATIKTSDDSTSKTSTNGFLFGKPRFYPFSQNSSPQHPELND